MVSRTPRQTGKGKKVKPEDFLDAGDRVVALGRYDAKHGATGKEVRSQFAHVWSLRDGKVTSFQQYTDTEALRASRSAPVHRALRRWALAQLCGVGYVRGIV